MSTASARTNRPQTEARILRRLQLYLAEQFLPPVCARIRATRERLKEQAEATGGREAAREFSQERVAARLHLSLKAYRAYEKDREPNYARRRAISKALGLTEDYFETAAAAEGAPGIDQVLEELAQLRGRVALLEAQPGAATQPPKRRRSA